MSRREAPVGMLLSLRGAKCLPAVKWRQACIDVNVAAVRMLLACARRRRRGGVAAMSRGLVMAKSG